MEFKEAHKLFVSYGAANGHTEGTIRCYNQDSSNFVKFLMEKELSQELEGINSKMIRLYTVWMHERGNARETIRRKLNYLASFFNYCEKEEHVSTNPMSKVDRPKPQKLFHVF